MQDLSLSATIDVANPDPSGLSQRVLNEADAAHYLGVSRAFLRRRRLSANKRPGPAFLKLGTKAAYLVDDLDAWLLSQRIMVREEG